MPEDIVDSFLRYGLFLGAIFQLICIAAVIVVPDKGDAIKDGDQSDDEISDHGSPHIVPHRPHNHRRKQEKKKRR